MSSFTKKWSNRTAELCLPRPRTIPLAGLDSDPAVDGLFSSDSDAVVKLSDVSLHQVARWEALTTYSKLLGEYASTLATHASTVDPDFLRPVTDFSDDERFAKIERLLDTEETHSHALAAALIYPTSFAAVGVALTAFAVNDNSRRSFGVAQLSLRRVDHFFADFELIERSVS